MMFTSLALSTLFLVLNADVSKLSLQAKIERIARSSEGIVGVAVLGLEDRKLITLNPDKRFPMQSVYKFPLALAVLKQVDEGKLKLGQNIHVTKQDLLPDTWSPLRDDHPEGNINVTLAELLKYTVSKSDNKACDILFRLIGGTKTVETFIHGLGVTDIMIKSTEEEMHQAWNVQYSNWSTPIAMANLLKLFYQGHILSESSTKFLNQIMIETSTGPKRIKGLLPKNAVVAHKTGTSNTNAQGVTAATNDVGIVTISQDKHLAIVVFVSDSTADEAKREKVIAQIARAAWDDYLR